MMRPLRHLTNVYLVMSLLAWIPMGARASVLCLEPSGRIVFEEGGACCAKAATYSTGDVASQGPDVAPDACGPCLDIRLGGPDGRIAPGQVTVLRPPLANQAIAGSGNLVTMLLAAHKVDLGPLPDAPPIILPARTTILRN
jgi:hypothetical protein